MSSIHNRELADIFHRMAACYRYLGTDQRFRAIAYQRAANTIQDLKDDISIYGDSIEQLEELNNIGESIAEKILEYLRSGKIHTFEELKKQVPEGLLELMDISGFGPSTVRLLHERFGISSKEELSDALEKNKLIKVKGFGKKKIENLKRGLKLYKEGHDRMLLQHALQIGSEILSGIRDIKWIQKAELAGSLRRRKETIGDIDIVACARRSKWKSIMNAASRLEQVDRILVSGDTKMSFLTKSEHIQVDIRLVHEQEYGAALFYFTGSREHNVQLRTWAKANGWKVNEYGVFDVNTGKHLAGATEEDIYKLFKMQYVPPELRENRGEIEAARKNILPELVDIKDIKGDMQMHSTWSDGKEHIESIATYIQKEFPQYEYIVMTDHSPSARIAGGLKPDEFLKQFKEIDTINKTLGTDFVKKGVEVDILTNGKMDLPDNLLKQFDWVVASIHSGFKQDNTERLIKACEHPYVHCIGHPSGRLIAKREAYPIDWNKLFMAAADTGTAIEINAQPERLDLKDDLVKAAIEAGVTITISTDAHLLSQFSNMTLGVSVARRGWCNKKNILNTASWKNVEAFQKRKQEKMETK